MLRVYSCEMGSPDLNISVSLLILVSCMVAAVLAEDEQHLQKRMCWRYRRMMSMMNKPQQQELQPPSDPVTEATLKDALTNNVCANYNPNTLFPSFNLSNMRELSKCKAAVDYLLSSKITRPADCQTAYGVRCGRDAQGKMVCMIKTQMGFLTYDEKPLSYCAQNFKPSDSVNPLNPQNSITPDPSTLNPEINNQFPISPDPKNQLPINTDPSKQNPINTDPSKENPIDPSPEKPQNQDGLSPFPIRRNLA